MSKEPRDTQSPRATGKHLLEEFDAPSYDEWRQTAEKSLKGAPFEKKLLTKTYEGLVLNPIYRREDTERLPHMHSVPGFTPFARGTRAAMHTDRPWGISHNYRFSLPSALSQAIGEDLGAGLSEIGFSLDRPGLAGADPDTVNPSNVGRGGVSLIDIEELKTILDAAAFPKIPVQIDAGSAGLAVAAMLKSHCERSQISLADVKGGVLMDPISQLARYGVSFKSTQQLYQEMAMLTRFAAESSSELFTVGVGSHCYHQSGANAVEELGFTVAHGVEYVRALLELQLPLEMISERTLFSFSVGGNFFMEVAKLRAARLLWALVIEAFGGNQETRKIHLVVRTSDWNKTAYDPYVNMLRSTTETFAAAIAGADSIQTVPFDETVRESNSFSRRIARNVQIVLQEESRLGKVIDPAGGAYYLETLTDYLAQNAWKLFQEVERLGGMSRALETGFVRKTIEKTASVRKKDLQTRKEVIIGTNIYANPDEQPLPRESLDQLSFATLRGKEAAEKRNRIPTDALQTSLAGKDAKLLMGTLAELAGQGATIGQLCAMLPRESTPVLNIEPLPIERRAKMFENLRHAVADHFKSTGKKVKVFSANMGPIPTHKARADFSAGFFEVAGIEVLKNDGFDTPEQAAEAALASGADAAVVCSTDDTYPEIVPRFTAKVREKNTEMLLILAGYPKDQIEEHRKSGIDEFIHLQADNYEILRNLLQKTGVAL